MWTLEEVNKRLHQAGLAGESWGMRGAQAVDRIEHGLDKRLGNDLRAFVIGVGNVRVDPFEVLMAGDDAGTMSAVTETLRLWRENPSQTGIQVMSHAGEVYLYYPETERVCAYDALRPIMGEETLAWDNFGCFMDWVFAEAAAMSKDTGFNTH